MSVEIIIAIFGFLGTTVGSCVGAFASSKLTNYRLEQLEKKVDQYHSVGERIGVMEQRMVMYEKQLTELEKKTQS